MINNQIADFVEELKASIKKTSKFLYFTRGIEFQKASITELDGLRKRSVELKEKMIELQNEESANQMLSLEYLVNSYIFELKTLVSLKEDLMSEAWDSLVKAQYNLRWSIQANDISIELGANNRAQRLFLMEKLIFPPQTFNSIGAIVESAKCSICNQEYGECEHMKGKPYMGKLCCRIIAKIKELREVSLVDDPGNKLCRVTSFWIMIVGGIS